METQVVNNNYICDFKMLKKAHDAMKITIDKLRASGIDAEPFLADYLLHGNLNYFTRGNDEYKNARKMMERIDKDILKRELFAMLVANAKNDILETKLFARNPSGLSYPLELGIEYLFCFVDSNTVEYLFNQLYDKMPEELNRYIYVKLKRMIEFQNSYYSWLFKNNHSENSLSIIEKIRKGKKRLNVIAARKVNNKVNDKVKKLKKDYNDGYYY